MNVITSQTMRDILNNMFLCDDISFNIKKHRDTFTVTIYNKYHSGEYKFKIKEKRNGSVDLFMFSPLIKGYENVGQYDWSVDSLYLVTNFWKRLFLYQFKSDVSI